MDLHWLVYCWYSVNSFSHDVLELADNVFLPLCSNADGYSSLWYSIHFLWVYLYFPCGWRGIYICTYEGEKCVNFCDCNNNSTSILWLLIVILLLHKAYWRTNVIKHPPMKFQFWVICCSLCLLWSYSRLAQKQLASWRIPMHPLDMGSVFWTFYLMALQTPLRIL